MASPTYASPNFSTTLNVGGGINNSQTTGIVLTSVSGLNTNGGILGIDWSATIDTSLYEEIEYTGVSGNELTGVTRGVNGFSAHAHNNLAVVVNVVSSIHNNRIADKLTSRDATLAQDPNENEIIKTSYNSSAVNELTIANAATANAPQIAATGNDSNIDINLVPKGTGAVKINGTAISASSDGWVSTAVGLTYSSVDGHTFVATTASDLSGTIGVGMKIKLTQTTAKYFIVTAIDASTITLYGGTDYTLANSAISSVYYSFQKSPFGFPLNPTKWSEELHDTSTQTQSTPAANTVYNPGSLKLDVPIGIWDLSWGASINCVGAAGVVETGKFYAGISTANNSYSDADFEVEGYVSGASNGTWQLTYNGFRQKFVNLASKTSYYLNASTSASSTTSLNIRGALVPTIVRAVCAYL